MTLRHSLPPRLAQTLKYFYSIPRYCIQRTHGFLGYTQFRDAYPCSKLLIAGLPKSGTSWLESMLASVPGFQPITPASAVHYELQHRGSHHMNIDAAMLDRLSPGLHVLKLHFPGTPQNASLLHKRRQRYIIQVRDIRDVAVSHVFYVRTRPWHPDYDLFSHRTLEESLALFAEYRLEEFVAWLESWLSNRDTELSLLLRYEDMLQAPDSLLPKALEHFGITLPNHRIMDIVNKHSFEKKTDGRHRGDERPASFQRKGIAGDWKNYFTPGLLDTFLDRATPILDRLGYL